MAEASNLYYTDARARAALSPSAPLTYTSSTGIVGLPKATQAADGYLSSNDWSTFNVAATLWGTSGGNVYRAAGNVGIGTTNPGAKLEIAGVSGADGIKFPDGTVQTSAGYVVKTKSSDYPITAADQNALFLVTGTTNLTLPSAVTVGANFVIKVKKTDVNGTFVSVTPTGGQTVDGNTGAYKFYTRNATATLISDGANWQAIDVLGTTSSTIQTCGQTAETNCYDNKVALLAGYAIVNITGTDYEIMTTTIGTSKIWVNLAADKVLDVNGLAAWQYGLPVSGIATSLTSNGGSILTSTANIGGRACPYNVYINNSYQIIAGRCLFYDTGNAGQALNANMATPNVTGFAAWTSGSPKWFQGNIDTCGNKGMRLPTLFETAGVIGPSSGIYTPLTTDGTAAHLVGSGPAYAGQKGVPSHSSGATWTASSSSGNTSGYWYWSGSSAGDYFYNFGYYVRCVLP